MEGGRGKGERIWPGSAGEGGRLGPLEAEPRQAAPALEPAAPELPEPVGREDRLNSLRQQFELLNQQIESVECRIRELEGGGQDREGEAVARVNIDQCAGCGVCIDVCPNDAIELRDGVAVVDEEACMGCGLCEGECPNEAIRLVHRGASTGS